MCAVRVGGHLWAAAGVCGAVGWSFTRVPAGQMDVLFEHLADLWPLGPHLAVNAAQSVASFLLAAGLLLLYDAAGVRLLRWLTGRRPAGAVRLTAVLLAYAVVSTWLMGASALGLWYPAVLLVSLMVLGAFGGPALAAVYAQWKRWALEVWFSAPLAGKFILGGLVLWWILLLVPPELDVDCMSYHLAFPQQVLTQHRLFGTDVYSHWAIPLVMEFPHVFPLLLNLDAAARIIGLAVAVLGALTFLRALRMPLTPAQEIGLVALALVLPAGRFVLATAKNDAPAVGYALASAGLFLHSGVLSREAKRSAEVLLAALLAGVLLAVKYLTLPLALSVAGIAVYRVRHAARLRIFLLVACGGLLPLLPWMFKSYLYLADPMYPLGTVTFPAWFGNPDTNEFTRTLLNIYVQGVRPINSFPMDMLVLAARNALLMVAAVPLLAVWRRPGLVPLLVGSVLGYAGMMLGWRGAIEAVERFALSVFVLWNLVAGAVLCRGLVNGWPVTRRILRPVCVVGAGALLVLGSVRVVAVETWPHGTWQRHMHPGAYLAGRLSRQEFRHTGLFAYGAILPHVRAAVEARDQGGTVLAIGENRFWDIPTRVRTQVFEPPFVWRAAHGTESVERLAVKFRQRNIQWVLYNLSLAGLGRYTYSPYTWSPRMLRLYAEYTLRHLTLTAFCGRADPHAGSSWLYEVERIPQTPPARTLFLPGAERAYAYAALAELHGAHEEAVLRFEELRRMLPEIVWLDSLLAAPLLASGRVREAYQLARGTVEAGLIDERNLLTWAVAAGRLGKHGEATEALRRAAAAYPLWPERVVRAGRQAGLVLKKAGDR